MEGGLSDIEAEVFYQASEDVEVKGCSNTVPQSLFINELPEDVLREIFIFALGKSCVTRTSAPPLLFLQICKHWGNVASSEPRLWANFEILINDDYNKLHLVKPRELGSTRWISRAQNLPKNICIQVTSNNINSSSTPDGSDWESSARGTMRDIVLVTPMNLETFTGSLSSCRQLLLRFGIPSPLQFYFRSHNMDATPMMLESFELLCHHSDAILDDLVPVIRNATRLCRLALGISPHQLFNFGVVWGQITHLNLIRVRLLRSEWLHIIEKTRRLEKAAFLLLDFEIIRETKITLPYLTHLVIRSHYPMHRPIPILGYVDLPALFYFKIARTSDPYFLKPKTLYPHPLQHLQTLCLLRVEFTTEEFCNLLQTATMLRALTLTIYPDSEVVPPDPVNYLKFFVYSEEEGRTLLPRLESLCLSLEIIRMYSILADIVASRQSIHLNQCIYSLRRLTLEYSPQRRRLSGKELLEKTAMRQFVKKWQGVLSVKVKPKKFEMASISAKIPWEEV